MKNILIICLAVLGIFSCKRDTVIIDPGSITFAVEYSVDDKALQFDTIKYVNAAGHRYSITHLEYFLSGFSFNRSDGSSYKPNSVFYVNAQKPLTNSIRIDNLPQGTYSSISFFIGLDSTINKTNSLPNTLDNINMAWPDAMGGGYHFMKMEGYFLDKINSAQNGYAMHLGKNVNLVKINFSTPLIITTDPLNKTMTMNINEWYKNPLNYDFEIDGNYSMSIANAMSKLTQNGTDVFTIK